MLEDYVEATETFGEPLRPGRAAAGLSRHELTRRIAARVDTLRNCDEDRREPSANKLQRLAGMPGLEWQA